MRSAQAGAAEMLLGLAGPLSRQGGVDYALMFYQVALYLDPDNTPALLGLGDLYQTIKQPERAVAVFDRIPSTSPIDMVFGRARPFFGPRAAAVGSAGA